MKVTVRVGVFPPKCVMCSGNMQSYGPEGSNRHRPNETLGQISR